MRKVYFVLYGAFDFKQSVKMKHGNQTEHVQFGERIGLGWTMGEEVEFIKPIAP